METSLHRDLKTLYAAPDARFEVSLGDYRIDVVSGDRLVEIQHGSLAAIRDKVRKLVDRHDVVVVKPIVSSKLLVRRAKKGGRVVARRMSPKRGRLLDLFDEMVYFTRVFPHRRLTLEVPLVDIEEWRYPGHGRRRRWRENDYQVEDQKLVAVHEVHRLQTAEDLGRLICCPLAGSLPHGPPGRIAGRPAMDRPANCLLPSQNGSRAADGEIGKLTAVPIPLQWQGRRQDLRLSPTVQACRVRETHRAPRGCGAFHAPYTKPTGVLCHCPPRRHIVPSLPAQFRPKWPPKPHTRGRL
jgi:hypothetical protein